MEVVLIGAGSVATQWGLALREKGYPVAQVYSRTLDSARALGERLNASSTQQIEDVIVHADLYIFAVKDSVLPEIVKAFPPVKGLPVHTAGSVPMDVFVGYFDRYGVIYPLQTFSKTRRVSFENIPIFIEANNLDDENRLEKFASTFSGKVVRLSSEKRRQLHLAAVFACNFTNYLYTVAAQILEEHDLPFDVLIPLIRETAAKVEEMHPVEAQTGPAVRDDKNLIDKQLKMLRNYPDKQELYRILSEHIHRESIRERLFFQKY
jgi:predicted short-subunit dehydrogenase-like oxidoreductase (DUF2520 family)